MIISFAWTTDAFLAGRKHCTRRDWKGVPSAAKIGSIHDGFDRNPRIHGHKIGNVKLTATPYSESTRDIPEGDFENEGFAYMEEKGLLIQGITPREFFNNWRASDQVLFVVRFDPVFRCIRCGTWKVIQGVVTKKLCSKCSKESKKVIQGEILEAGQYLLFGKESI